MKKLFVAILVLISLSSFAQDSVRVTVSVQARDLYFICDAIYRDDAVEDLFDTLRAKLRIPTPPTGTTTVAITAYAKDWIDVLRRLRNDPLAFKFQHADRVNALLAASGNGYITTQINALDAVDISANDLRINRGYFRVTRKNPL